MLAEQSEAELRKFIAQRGVEFAALRPDEALDLMVTFFTTVEASDCLDDVEGDMLLFQWGTYGWDERPENFQIDFTRQFMTPRECADPDCQTMSQLSLRLHYEPNAMTEAAGSGDRWSERGAIDEFARFARVSAAFRVTRTMAPSRVEIGWSIV